MSPKKLLFLSLLVLLPATVQAEEHRDDVTAITSVIDDFHDAAAKGDATRYLGHLTEDAVFMGTDEWERWPKNPDFRDYVDSRFKNGSGWDYQSVQRTIRLSETAHLAWFDEVIYSKPNGRFRGTGVLTREDGEWKIAHYAMSFLILNENWPEVIELTAKTRELIENSALAE